LIHFIKRSILTMSPPIYSGSADEWSYLSTGSADSAVTYEFIIDNFENQMMKATTLKSGQFTVKNTLWHVEVISESQEDDRKGCVGIFLHNDNKKAIAPRFKFTIGDGDEVEEIVPEIYGDLIDPNDTWGFPTMLTHGECKDLLIDGKLKINVTMKVLEDEGTLILGKGKSFNPIPDTSSINLKIFEDKASTDFCVLCNGKFFPCHKIFLTARSSVFKTMIESNMKEAKEGVVKFENCTETVADSFVKFFYTGKVDEEVLRENVISFLDLGEKYDLKGLKAIAEQVMIANLDKDNMISFFLAADLYNGEMIKSAAKTFLRQNIKSLVQQDGWKDTLKDHVFELLETFAED